ncbi:aldehyde dehydrogenase-like protein [Paraphaeosphaeria sporulosa]|uniref:aldehyde dehydrogenase (NAD(+)) n=1 Tax=Paraphaeosphaeria sporulosa TaxID=1460663 RepID=A0A177CBI3_9PLEO|nr:aldehyde dehydrogenase-like protein [Paraphaeosphaeria sporulosa]OAG05014.1 aldehyde dehydrogenase-like protein [Paraphaeosphaeria sporulosa]
MERFEDHNPLLLYAVGVVTLYLFYRLFRIDPEAAVTYNVAPPGQVAPGWKGEVLQELSMKVPGSTLIQCYAPATGESLGHIKPSTTASIDSAIAKAAAAQTQWAQTSFAERRQVLKTMLKFVLENQETIARVACLDSGKTMVDASLGEILVTVEKLRWVIAHGEESLRSESRPGNLLMAYKWHEVMWQPLGVVAACVSWNYPFHNLISPVIASIFAGNAIIVKGSENTAWSSSYFASIATSALIACGHSPDIVQSVVCWPNVAEHLTSHPGIAHITFIGSRPVAHHVCASASKALTPVCVELGGKDPAIVLDDLSNSDFHRVSSILMRGVFQSAGQNCIGIERIIALPNVYARLIEHLTPRIKALRPGSILNASCDDAPIDIGACISDAGFSRLESLIADAVTQGARLVCGGKRYVHPQHPKGHFFSPTFLIDVTPSMTIAQEELFAPVFTLMRADSVDQAIRIANSTPYALGASVYGSSSRDTERVVRGVNAGMVAVNDFAVTYMVQLPFGGVKGSGYGRFAGQEGLRSVCNQKAVTRDRWPWLVKTSIPGPMDLPLKGKGAGARAWKMACGVVWVGYGDLRGKIIGIKNLVGL